MSRQGPARKKPLGQGPALNARFPGQAPRRPPRQRFNLRIARWLTERAKDAGLHDLPAVRARIARTAALGSERLANRLAELFRRRALPRVVADEVFPTPRRLPRGPIFAGSACLNGARVGLPGCDGLDSDVGVFGAKGTGKSTEMKWLAEQWMLQGASVWWLDWMCDFTDVACAYPRDVLYVRFSDIKVNAFQPFSDDPADHIATVKEVFGSHYVGDGGKNLLASAVLDEYRRRGVLEGSRDYPTCQDILDRLQQMRPGPRERGYLDGLVNRLRLLSDDLASWRHVKESVDLDGLTGYSMVVSMAGASKEASLFWLETILGAIEELRQGRNVTGADLIIVLSETHRFLYEEEGSNRK